MLRWLLNRFRTTQPVAQWYTHPSLGTFQLSTPIGWTRTCRIDNRNVDVVIGSDGAAPATTMASTAADWALNWADRRHGVMRYINEQLSIWPSQWDPISIDDLELVSIHVLWDDLPTTAMLYFDDINDDTRLWHATFNGLEPHGFAFDD